MAERSMSEFSVTDAAFAGFRLASHKPMVVVTWAAFYFVMSTVTGALMVNLAGPAMMQLQNMQGQILQVDVTGANSPAVVALFARVLPFYLMMIPVSLVFGAIAVGAGTRAILRPAEDGFSYLRLGADELRLVVVILVIGIIMAVIYFAGAVVMGVLLGAAGAGGAGGAGLLILIALIGLLLAAMLYLASRFSLAPSLTLDRKAISIFDSLALTRRHSARIFLTYVLTLLLNIMIICAGLAVVAVAAVAMGAAPTASAKMLRPDMSSLTAYFTPLEIIQYAVMAVAGGLGMAITLAAPATIYKSLTRDGAHTVF